MSDELKPEVTSFAEAPAGKRFAVYGEKNMGQ